MGNKDLDVSRVVNGGLDLRWTERIPQDCQIVLVEDESAEGDGHAHVVYGTAEDLAEAGYAGRGSTERKLHKIVKDTHDEEPVTEPVIVDKPKPAPRKPAAKKRTAAKKK